MISSVTFYDSAAFPPAVDPQFAHKPGIVFLRSAFALLSVLAPNVAARFGLRLFLTPPRHKTPEKEAAVKAQAKVFTIVVNGKSIAVYEWGEGPMVLLSHSWGGRATQLGGFIKPLVEAGYRVVAFDGPAHGASSGKQTDMVEFSKTIRAVADAYGPVYAVIGHSFGAANSLLAVRDCGLAPAKLALIGCFAHGIWVIETFGALLNIPRRVVERMRRMLERRYQGELVWESLSLVSMARDAGAPIFLVHDTEDKEVPYAHALAIHKEAPRSRLKTTSGHGHRRILRDNEVIRDVVQFVVGPADSLPGYSEQR